MERHLHRQRNVDCGLSQFGWQLTYYSLRIIMQMSQALLILMSLFFLAVQVQVDVAVVLLHRLKQLDEKKAHCCWGVGLISCCFLSRHTSERERERETTQIDS